MTSNITPNSTNSNSDLNAVKDDIATLRSDFTKFADDAGSLAQSSGKKALQRRKDVAEDVGDEFKVQKARAEDMVREHPLAAVGIAFGIGLFVSMMRRS